MRSLDLGFEVRFRIDPVLIDDIELWTHEFSEMSISNLLEDYCIISLMIDDVSGSSIRTSVSIPHIMVALHTSSSIEYLDGSEKVLKPDEFAFQILGWKNSDEMML